MARKLGVSQQYVNRQLKQHNVCFNLDGEKVVAINTRNFFANGKRFDDKEDLAMSLGVPKKVVAKAFRKHNSGIIKTPQGEVKIQKIKPGEKPTLPAVRVLWNDDTEKQDFVSFAAAAKELKIHHKTIPSALKAGRDSFTRKSDGKKFTFEIPKENTPSRKKPKPPSEEEKAKKDERVRQLAMESEVINFYDRRVRWNSLDSYQTQVKHLEKFWPGVMEEIREKHGFGKEPDSSQEEPISAKEEKDEEPSSAEEEEEEDEEPSSAEEEEEEEKDEEPPISRPIAAAGPPALAGPPAEPPPELALPLGKTTPVMGHLHNILEAKREEKQLQVNVARRFQKPDLSKLEKELKELQLQEEHYLALRIKYAGWFLEDFVESEDETQTVLYNPNTGEDFLVEEDEYDLLAQFFSSRGYVDFLSRSDFIDNWSYGKLQFPAQKSSELPEENWMLLNFIKDP